MTKTFILGILFCAVVVHAQDTVVPHAYHVVHYDENINIGLTDSSVTGICSIQLISASDTLANVWLNLVGLTVDSVKVDSTIVRAFKHDSNYIYINLAGVKSSGTQFTVQVYYHGKPTQYPGETWGGTYFGNPMRTIGVGFVYPGISMTRYWMPCYDLPDEKATAAVSITVPHGYVAASNGMLKETIPNANGIEYVWHEDQPIATYLMCIAVGTYSVISSSVPPLAGVEPDTIPIRIYALPQDSANAATFFSFLPGITQYFESRYGPYPVEKVGYALVPNLGGGMEHQSLISFEQTFMGDTNNHVTAAHELSHQWWGDMVTPHDFRDAWLNEGFACFSEALFYEWEQGPAGYVTALHNRMSNYFKWALGNGSFGSYGEGVFPLYGFPRKSPSSNYPETIYFKGASVMGMLRWMLGDSTFFAGLQFYGQQNKYGNVTTAIFEQAMDSISQQDLSWFFNEWVYKAGWPQLKVNFSHTNDSLYVTILQTQDTTKFPFFRMPVEIAITNTDSLTSIHRITMAAVDSQVITIPLTDGIMSAAFDPNGHLLTRNPIVTYTAVNEPRTTVEAQPFLMQNYPNPIVEGHTTVLIDPSYTNNGLSRLALFDILGRQVRDYTPLLASHPNAVSLDLTGIPAGVYFYCLETPHCTLAKPLTLSR